MNTDQIAAEEAANQIQKEFPKGWHYNKETITHHIKAAIEKAIDESNHFATLEEAHIESRAEHEGKPVTELVEALRMLRDFQNGCPLPSYEKGWNEAMRLTDDALRKYESQPHASDGGVCPECGFGHVFHDDNCSRRARPRT